ncbi:2-amino-4-hydroxy-6-hydroxymethyldihydropteridine diphosphokinase [Thermodesulfobacteriota bacterium]
MMNKTFIGLGSNLGERGKNILTAWEKINTLPETETVRLSSPFSTKPVEIISENWFINAVGLVTTFRSCHTFLQDLLAVEIGMGRDRLLGRDRIIDIDILFYGDAIESTHELTVPHPEIQNRLFVLAPLAELAPTHRHPVLGKTMTELLSAFEPCDQTAQITTW